MNKPRDPSAGGAVLNGIFFSILQKKLLLFKRHHYLKLNQIDFFVHKHYSQKIGTKCSKLKSIGEMSIIDGGS